MPLCRRSFGNAAELCGAELVSFDTIQNTLWWLSSWAFLAALRLGESLHMDMISVKLGRVGLLCKFVLFPLV